MRNILFVIFTLSCVLLVSSLTFAQAINHGAYFVIDTNLSQAGCQENLPQTNIGPGEKVGFAIYAGNVDGSKSFNIDIQWDSNLATHAKSGVSIGEDDITINGQEISLARETNIFGDGLTSFVEDNMGHFTGAYALLNGEPVVEPDEGLLYYFELVTANDFSDIKELDVSVVVTLDSGGVEPPVTLSKNTFLVNTIFPETKLPSWSEIKKKYKNF